jgi:hypothetical protein
MLEALRRTVDIVGSKIRSFWQSVFRMASTEETPVPPDETVLKNVPKGRRFREKKTGAILPSNFELRNDEQGKSVWQARLWNRDRVVENTPESLRGDFASATVEVVIDEQKFDVLDVPDDIDGLPGHAEIRGNALNLNDLAARQLLCELFVLPQ